MSGDINETREFITKANGLLSKNNLELDKPREECETALGLLATVLSTVSEIRWTNASIAEKLQEASPEVTTAKDHLDSSITHQRLLGLDQLPSADSPGHRMFTQSSAALEAATALQADLATGIDIATTRDAKAFDFFSFALEATKGPLETIQLLIDNAKQKNTDAIGFANTYMEKEL